MKCMTILEVAYENLFLSNRSFDWVANALISRMIKVELPIRLKDPFSRFQRPLRFFGEDGREISHITKEPLSLLP